MNDAWVLFLTLMGFSMGVSLLAAIGLAVSLTVYYRSGAGDVE